MAYVDDILAQPSALQATLEGLTAIVSLSSIAEKVSSGKYRRIVLTGMGSSYHALAPLTLRLIGRGMCAQMLETSELIHPAAALIEAGTLIVAVSQSGESAEIVHLLNRMQKNVTVIGVTNSPESNLARQATVTVLTRAGQEASVSCKTYLATLVALCWLGDQLIGDPSSAQITQLFDTPELVIRYLSGWQGHVSRLKERLAGIQHLFLVGRGVSLAAAGTGGLIIKEAAHFHAEGMSSAAFRHGPFEMLSPQVFVAVLTGSDETAELNLRLARDVVAAGGQAEAIRKGSIGGPFELPADETPVLPILEILPVQMMSLALAALQGIEAGQFERGAKVTTIE